MRRIARTMLVLVMAWCTLAVAQSDVSGVLTGAIDGEARTWYTIEAPGMNTAEWLSPLAGMYTFSLQGHAAQRYVVAGTITLDLSFFSMPSACPCAVDMASIMYFASDSMMQDFYETDDAEVTITEIEWLDDDVVLLSGSFEGTLYYRADFRDELDDENPLVAEGTFEVRAHRTNLDD
ncbi:hypothetical protein BH23DEI1_BH23DEI1_08920 [soil metagenome]